MQRLCARAALSSDDAVEGVSGVINCRLVAGAVALLLVEARAWQLLGWIVVQNNVVPVQGHMWPALE